MLYLGGTESVSTKNSYSPHCYKTTSTIPHGWDETKIPHQDFWEEWYTSIPPFHWAVVSNSTGAFRVPHKTCLYSVSPFVRSQHRDNNCLVLGFVCTPGKCVCLVRLFLWAGRCGHSLFLLVVVWFLVMKHFKEQISTMCRSDYSCIRSINLATWYSGDM